MRFEQATLHPEAFKSGFLASRDKLHSSYRLGLGRGTEATLPEGTNPTCPKFETSAINHERECREITGAASELAASDRFTDLLEALLHVIGWSRSSDFSFT